MDEQTATYIKATCSVDAAEVANPGVVKIRWKATLPGSVTAIFPSRGEEELVLQD
jgi:hypothetical protein